jgi:hypothetical protein
MDLNFSKRISPLCVGLSLCWLVACAPERQPLSPSVPHAPARTISGPAVQDVAMGSLSPFARHVVAGLQDPKVRGKIVRAMKNSHVFGVGLDLEDCGPNTVIGDLLEAGAMRGGAAASHVCGSFQQSGGIMLYMDRDRLAHWDSTVIPVVTAIQRPEIAVPTTFVGYRSPTRTIQLYRDAPLDGPVLVLLPFSHPHRWNSRAARPARVRPLIVPERPAGGRRLPPQSLPTN